MYARAGESRDSKGGQGDQGVHGDQGVDPKGKKRDLILKKTGK